MRKLLVFLTTLALLATPAMALAEGATLNAECFDWGEAITSITVELDAPVEGVPEVTVEATVTYFSYATYSTVTETVTREILDVAVDGSKITLTLEYAFGDDGDKAFPDSVENYVVTVNGAQVPVVALSDPALDAFVEGKVEDTPYRLFVPEVAEGATAPMVVWLHGAGESGADNRLQISANLVTNWATPESQAYFGGAAYILAPQSSVGHDPAVEMAMIEQVIETYGNVDVNRIYVGGCSMGGAGTVNMITKYPDFFAAAFPICAAADLSPEASAALAAAKMPVYFIHSIDDTTCNVSSSLVGVRNMLAAGGEGYAALFDRVACEGLPDEIALMLGHWSWVYVHRNFDGLGDDYDGLYFHKGEYTGSKDTTLYDGAPFDFYSLDMNAEGFNWSDQSTWKFADGTAYDPALETVESEEITVTSVTPVDLGYECFFAWLAAQSK